MSCVLLTSSFLYNKEDIELCEHRVKCIRFYYHIKQQFRLHTFSEQKVTIFGS